MANQSKTKNDKKKPQRHNGRTVNQQAIFMLGRMKPVKAGEAAWRYSKDAAETPHICEFWTNVATTIDRVVHGEQTMSDINDKAEAEGKANGKPYSSGAIVRSRAKAASQAPTQPESTPAPSDAAPAATLTPAGNPVPTFTSDHRQTNPGLHLFYTKQAVQHLQAIGKIQRMLTSFHNGNMLDMQIAVEAERKKLVETNAAYADAQEILDSIKLIKG